MESLFLNLVRIIKQQDETLAELLNTAEKHNLALRKNYTRLVLSSANQQEELSYKLKHQGRKLEAAKRQLAGEYGIAEKAGLSVFIRYASEPLATDLKKASQSLKDKLLRLSEINSLNGVLARRGQVFTEKLLRIMSPSGGSIYMGSGRLKKESKPLQILDSTI